MKRKSIWPLLLAATIGLAILLSLGIWQVNRLAEKQALIASIEARMIAAPISLGKAVAQHDQAVDIEFMRVKASGRFLETPAFRRLSTFEGGPGWTLIQPFQSDDGVFVLVERGSIALDDKDQSAITAPAGTLTIDGLLRRHDKGRGLFDEDNDEVGNQWFWWDIPAMIARAQPPAEVNVAPFILHLLPNPQGPAKPFVAAPKAELRNNHLGYAITWFGLAAVLLVMTAMLVMRIRKA